MSSKPQPWKAPLMLVLATAFWGISFPVMKALTQTQQQLVPGCSSWFTASLCVTLRLGASALIMLLVSLPTLRGMTRLEVWQGIGLGLFGTGGLLFQMDGLAYTAASTSAFLTQCYCLLIPLWLAVHERRAPSPRSSVACLLVVAGVAVLSEVDWRHLTLGRGEVETIIGSVLFTGQILWLQRPKYSANNVNHFTLVMFAVMALASLPVACVTTPAPRDWLRAYSTGATIAFLAILVFSCTLGGYLLMNYWQPRVSATEAGLIYCAEPVFASLFALFLPGWCSGWAGVQYANETVTWTLLAGGGLITAANVLIQLRPPVQPPTVHHQ
jgi:drug/metabolite transporter (DMT)-like permease